MSLVPVVLIAALTACLLQIFVSIGGRQAQSLDEKKAFYVAEAGLSEAMTGLSLGLTGNIGSREEPAYFGQGLVWVVAEDAGADRLRLESHGWSGSGRVTLSMVVEKVRFNFGAFGFFSTEKVTVDEGTLIDGFDSQFGTYAEQLALGMTETAGRVVSSQAIEIKGGTGSSHTTIHGSAEPGLGSAVELEDGVTITGHMESLEEYMVPPVADVPVIELEAKIEHDESFPLVISSGVYGYEELVIEEARELIIRGPVTLLVEKLEIEDDASIEFDSSAGEITIYVVDELKLKENSEARVSAGSLRDVAIFATPADGASDSSGPDVKFEEGVFFEGFLYAPRSEVKIEEESEVFGAVVAEELKLEESVSLHFDTSLGGQDHLTPELVGWRVVSIETGPVDPFRELGTPGTALTELPRAHEDVWLEIKYRPADGVPKVEWTGWFHDFDWDSVYDLHHYKVYESDGGEELMHVHP